MFGTTKSILDKKLKRFNEIKDINTESNSNKDKVKHFYPKNQTQM